MFYFILWVVFLLAVVLAVPITSFLEKRKISKPLEDDRETGSNDEWTDEAEGQEEGLGSDDQFGGDAEVVETFDEEFASFEELK